MPHHERRFARLKAPDVHRLLTSGSILVQPVGAIEQHGPHLPLNTDLVIAEAVASAAIAAVGDDVDAWLLPPLAYTKSDEHAWSAGTMWLSASTLLAVLDDLGRCVATTPARRLVFLNGHGGNSALLGASNRELRLRYGLMTFLAHPGVPVDQRGALGGQPRVTGTPGDEVPDGAEGTGEGSGRAGHGGAYPDDPGTEAGMGIHAGTDETSIMLHLAPELVDMDAAVRAVPAKLAANRYVRFGGPVSFGWLSNDFGDSGVIGDPLPATAERGAALFAGAVEAFCGALREIAHFDFGR